MARERSYETEKRYRKRALRQALERVQREAGKWNEPGWASRTKTLEVARGDAMDALWSAAMDLDYLEWEARGAIDDDE